MCAYLSADPSVDAERFELDDDLLIHCFNSEQFTKSYEATRQFENICNIVRKAGRAPYVYQSSHDERKVARCVPYQEYTMTKPPERKPFDIVMSALNCFSAIKSAFPVPQEFDVIHSGHSGSIPCLSSDRNVLRSAQPAIAEVDGPEVKEGYESLRVEGVVEEKPAHSSLAWYWNEDKRRGEEHNQPVLPFHVIVMNMVDPYVDWDKLAVQQPILFRTLRITEVCGRDTHRIFRFTSDNVLEYTTVSHSDSFSGERRLKTFKHGVWVFENGREISFGGCSYRVHVRDPNPNSDYRFVLLMPIARIHETVEELVLGFFGVNPRYTQHTSYPGPLKSIIRSFALRARPAVVGGQLWRYYASVDPKEPGFLIPPTLSRHYTYKRIYEAKHTDCFYRPEVAPAPPIRRLETSVKGERNFWSVLVVHKVGTKPVVNPTYQELVNHNYERDEPLNIDETLLVQIALVGDFDYVTVSHSMFCQMLSRSKLSAADAVEQFQWKVPRDRALLLDFIKDTKGTVDLNDVPFVLLYEASNQRYDTVKIKGVQPLMRQLGVVTPHGPVTNSGSNEARGVNKRIGAVMAGPNETQVTPEVVEHGKEFVGFLKARFVAATGRTRIEPKPYEEVIEHQATAYKRQTVETSICANDGRPLKKANESFVKNEIDGGEADGKIKGQPRIISTKERDKVKASYLSYMYALKEVIMFLPCCAVGRSVRWVEEAIKRLARGSTPGKLFEAMIHDLPHPLIEKDVEYTALRTFEGDLSRQDGRKDCPWRVIFDMILCEFFTGSDRDNVRKLHAATIAMKMRTKTGGAKYCSGHTMGSGMPDTTVNNTLENMFISYHALRKKGYGPDEAWEIVLSNFLFAGDDSVGKELHQAEFMGACSDLHHLGKYAAVGDDDPLGFLGRKFGPSLRVLRAVVMSVHDPARALIKFTCCTKTLPKQEDRRRRLFDKAQAVRVTDRHSFAISTVAECITKAAEKEYGWQRYDNFDLNYNLQVKDEMTGENATYFQEPNEWSEALYRKTWPAVDFDAMVDYFSVDRTFVEIETHPIFGQPVKCEIDSGLTVYERPLDHSEPTEIVKHGTMKQEKLEVSDGDDTTNLDPKKQSQYKKAFHAAVKVAQQQPGAKEKRKTPIEPPQSGSTPAGSSAVGSGASPKNEGGRKDKVRREKTVVFSEAAIAANALRTKPRNKCSRLPVSEELIKLRADNAKPIGENLFGIVQSNDDPPVESSRDKSQSSEKSAATSDPVVGQSTEKVAKTPRPNGKDRRRGGNNGAGRPRPKRK
uniref:RNA replicase n=1 Tax=Beihai noda-like virus 2 TaxID=1922473 RepID=A0A1L3KFY6_9VIRU|nr:hypothetical protein 1 [Beihai noda-like virus 2]